MSNWEYIYQYEKINQNIKILKTAQSSHCSQSAQGLKLNVHFKNLYV